MSEIKHKNQILAAIEHLRSRKARPDIGRICKFMLRAYKVNPRDTRADLKCCVRERSIIKVDYKDNVSYRNAATWKRASFVMANERRIITSAIATLIYQNQSYLENGIAFEDLVRAAASQDTKFSKKQLEGIVQKELSSGSLVQLPNGNLALGPADHDGDSSDSGKMEFNTDSNIKMTSSANSSARSSPQQRMRGRPKKRNLGAAAIVGAATRSAAVRVGERRKMAKKVFDPSDNNVPSKRKRGRPVGSLNKSTIKKQMMVARSKEEKESESQSMDGSGDEGTASGGVCCVCRTLGGGGRLLECRDCSNKAHARCVAAGGLLRPRPDATWQCPHCKTCTVCCETNDAGVLTVCSICSDAYHALCHSPRIPERLTAWEHWECRQCAAPAAGSPSAIAPPAAPEDPFLRPHELDRADCKDDDAPIDPSIPDITNWTTDDVYEYFSDHFPEAAQVLKDQEFDGSALSMARRGDIVWELGLPLGPALMLYRLVVRLQARRDDWTLCWG